MTVEKIPAAIRQLILCLFLFAGFSCSPAFGAIEEGHELNSLPSLTDLQGGVFSFADLKDTYTIFIFFSMYSDTSGDLLDFAGRLHHSKEFAAPLQVIGVNIDPSKEAVKSYLKKYQLPFRVLMDISLELAGRFAVKEMPTIFLVGPDGVVLLSEEGFSPKEKDALLKKLRPRLGTMPERPVAGNEDAAETDLMYQAKEMVSAGAGFVKFCPVCSSLLLYISDEHVLLTYDFRSGKRTEIAADVGSADWSPDGKAIVFANRDKPGVWIKPLDGEAKKVSPEGRDPAWSSHYNMIAFLVGENEVWVSRLTVGKRWKVAANGVKVQWSPDGTLLMVQDRKNRVWLVSPYSRASLLKTIFD